METDRNILVTQDYLAGPQVITQSVDVGSPRERHKIALFKLGIVEIVLGGIAFIISLLPVIIGYGQITYGIAFPILLIITGVLGVYTKSNPSVGLFNANMVCSILSSIGMGIITTTSFIRCVELTNYDGYVTSYHISSITSVTISVAVFCLISTIVCIVHSGYCCAGVCSSCGQNSIGNGMVLSHQVNDQPYRNGQYMIQAHQIPAAQYVYPVGSTILPPAYMENNGVAVLGKPNNRAMSPPVYNG